MGLCYWIAPRPTICFLRIRAAITAAVDRSETDSANLTGVWQGLYSYDWGDDEGFVATLLHTGTMIYGSTHENDTRGWSDTPVLFALIEGRCDAAQVSFRKTYDGSGGWSHTVQYDGVLAPDGAEIQGTWFIPGEATGRFLMIRQDRVRQASQTLANAKA
jgi:hypothetical protein